MSFFNELKRRNVFKVGIAYAVTTWILLQLTDVVSDIMMLPEWAPKLILLMLVVGFVPALIPIFKILKKLCSIERLGYFHEPEYRFYREDFRIRLR